MKPTKPFFQQTFQLKPFNPRAFWYGIFLGQTIHHYYGQDKRFLDHIDFFKYSHNDIIITTQPYYSFTRNELNVIQQSCHNAITITDLSQFSWHNPKPNTGHSTKLYTIHIQPKCWRLTSKYSPHNPYSIVRTNYPYLPPPNLPILSN